MSALPAVAAMPSAADRASRSFYRPELDALRFAAFALVFLHHTLPRDPGKYGPLFGPKLAGMVLAAVQAAGFGLCLFFSLSAYLIAELLIRERLRTGSVHVQAFYQRRILRIWPLYFVGVGIGFLIALWPPQSYADRSRFLAYLLLSGNWYCVFHGWSTNAMNPLWSISVEEQFYLLWPTVAKHVSQAKIQAVCALMIAISWATLAYLGHVHADPDISIWANTFVQFSMFAGGILLAVRLAGRTPEFGAGTRALLALAALALWFLAAYACDLKAFNASPSVIQLIGGYSFVCLGCILLMLSLLGISARSVPRPLLYLGKISYGLYVFHLVGSQFAARVAIKLGAPVETSRVVAGFALTVACAALSYRYLETPFLRLKDRFAFVHTRSI